MTADYTTAGQFQGGAAHPSAQREAPPKDLTQQIPSSKKPPQVSTGMTKARQRIEDIFHESVADYLDAMLPAECWWTTFPAGGGGKARGGQLKAKGLKAGVPDILIVQRGKLFGVELKSPKGIVSDEQTNTHADLVAVGVPVAVCHTLDGIDAALRRWGFQLKGRLA